MAHGALYIVSSLLESHAEWFRSAADFERGTIHQELLRERGVARAYKDAEGPGWCRVGIVSSGSNAKAHLSPESALEMYESRVKVCSFKRDIVMSAQMFM